MAYRNLQRRKGKALLIAIGLSVAVAAFVLVLSLILSLRATMNDRLSKYGSNLLVMPASSELNLSYGGMSIEGTDSGQVAVLSEQDLQALKKLPSASRISAALPVLLQPVDIEGSPFLGLGTDVAQSLVVKPWWKVEGAPPTRPDDVLLGLNVRESLKTRPGDTISVGGRSFRVAGTLWETGGEEDNAVIFDRATLADVAERPGDITLIEVTADDGKMVDQLVAEIEKSLPDASVTSIRKSIEFTNQANDALAGFGLVITVLIVAVAAVTVAVTMLTVVKERQKEIGVFRAVGYKQRHIAQLVLLEAAMLSSAAALAGVGLGALAGVVAPRAVPALTLHFSFSPIVAVAGVALSFAIGMVAALYPARHAANMDPVNALKYI